MGIRLTGISTLLVGVTWEHTKEREKPFFSRVVPEQKIKVFIGSICGVEKYDIVREELKRAIEETQLADVYLFEEKGAATLSAEMHYGFSLEDSDVCIFLIDNADGINPDVLAEIDLAAKKSIRALYYFCDENSTKKTSLENSLRGARFAESKTVHKFNDLSKNGALDLINDVLNVYHGYCQNKTVLELANDDHSFQQVDIAENEKLQIPVVPKTVLKFFLWIQEMFISKILLFATSIKKKKF